MIQNRTRLFSILLAIFAGSTAALAQVDNPALSQNLGWAVVKTIAALFFILGLFFIAVYLVKKYYPKAFGGTLRPEQTESGIDLLAVRPLGGKRFIYLLGVGRKRVLVGMSESRMEALSEWEEEEEGESTSNE